MQQVLEQTMRTSNTVEVQACCSVLLGSGGALLMRDAVAETLNSTAVYVARVYTVASSGVSCALLLYQATNQDMVAESVVTLSSAKMTVADGTPFEVDASPWIGTDLDYLGAPLPAGWTVADLVLWGGCALGLLLTILSALCCYAILSQHHHHTKKKPSRL